MAEKRRTKKTNKQTTTTKKKQCFLNLRSLQWAASKRGYITCFGSKTQNHPEKEKVFFLTQYRLLQFYNKFKGHSQSIIKNAPWSRHFILFIKSLWGLWMIKQQWYLLLFWGFGSYKTLLLHDISHKLQRPHFSPITIVLFPFSFSLTSSATHELEISFYIIMILFHEISGLIF